MFLLLVILFQGSNDFFDLLFSLLKGVFELLVFLWETLCFGLVDLELELAQFGVQKLFLLLELLSEALVFVELLSDILTVLHE